MPKEVPPATFDGRTGEKFEDYYNQVRGVVRRELTRRYLEPDLPIGVSQTLDFGGGDGGDTLWLAGLGHKVMLLDESDDELTRAQTNISQASADQQGRITVCRGGINQLDALEAYDVILSHGVLMYADDPKAQLQALALALKPNGIMSLLTKGLSGALERAARGKNQPALQQLQTAGSFVNHLGVKAYAYTPAKIGALLGGSGLTISEWNGVRTLPKTDEDRRYVKDIEPQELQNIIDEEFQAGQSGRKGMAQMLHFIVRKAQN